MTRYSVPSRLAFVVPDDTAAPQAFLMALPDGQPVFLSDTAATIWILAVTGETDIAAGVGRAVGMARSEVASDVDKFLIDLVEKKLLQADGD